MSTVWRKYKNRAYTVSDNFATTGSTIEEVLESCQSILGCNSVQYDGASSLGDSKTFSQKVSISETIYDATTDIYEKICSIDLSNCDERLSGGDNVGST